MKTYECKLCSFCSHLKGDYTRHLRSKKHEKNVKLTNKYHSHTNNYQLHKCKYCQKDFKHASGLSRHVNYYCKKNKDEDLKELVRLLNEQMQEVKDKLAIVRSNEKLQKDRNYQQNFK